MKGSIRLSITPITTKEMNGRRKVEIIKLSNPLTVSKLLERGGFDEREVVYRAGIPLKPETVVSEGDILII